MNFDPNLTQNPLIYSEIVLEWTYLSTARLSIIRVKPFRQSMAFEK